MFPRGWALLARPRETGQERREREERERGEESEESEKREKMKGGESFSFIIFHLSGLRMCRRVRLVFARARG